MKTPRSSPLVKTSLALAALAFLAPGCAKQGVWSGVFSMDATGGAKTCVAPIASPSDGQTVAAQIQMSNEGGWCGITATRGGAAFDSYLMAARPTHGKVFAHRVGTSTRIDYIPAAGFTGTDSFSVRLVPGNAVIQGSVSVTR